MAIGRRQARAARAWLNLDQREVSEGSGVSTTQISAYESGNAGLSPKNLAKLETFFVSLGIELMEYDGVRGAPSGSLRQLQGAFGFREFLEDVYLTVKDQGGHVCVTNVDERKFARWHGRHMEDYLARMAKVPNLTFQILVRQGDDYNTASTYAEYREISQPFFTDVPTYTYGDKKAEIVFSEDEVTIFLLKNRSLADAQRALFSRVWDQLDPESEA